MSHLHIDAIFGAAGDMFLAAFLDAGFDPTFLRNLFTLLPLDPFELQIDRVLQGEIAATTLRVVEPPSSSVHRRLQDFLSLLLCLRKGGISTAICDRAQKGFHLLAEAEARVHGISIEEVEFHELSGLDTFVDILGVSAAIEAFNIQSVSCTPVTTGWGKIACRHGVFPVPTPATLEILRQHRIPFQQGEEEGEWLTPTGAVLLALLTPRWGPAPAMEVERIGYGAGSRLRKERLNILRVTIGDRSDSRRAECDHVVELRTVIDDITPEELALLREHCLAAGALEVYNVPAMMKKGRMGWEVTVLAPPDSAYAVEESLFRQGRTFGIRIGTFPRSILAREWIEVEVAKKKIRVKIGRRRGEILTLQPEFEDCRIVAEAEKIPLHRVMQRAEEEAYRALQKTEISLS